MTSNTAIIIRGSTVEEDANGHWNLNDIWALAKAPASRAPKHWRGSKATTRLIAALQQKVTSGYLKENKPTISVIYARRGRGNEGTFAHPVLAASYAGYLSEKLEIETREVWLRYRSGDASLADEILERASAADNEWAGTRALSRSQRTQFTATLQAHGVAGRGYGVCTNAVYTEIFGRTANGLRSEKSIPRNGALRDHLSSDELVSVMFAEMLSKQNIETDDAQGNMQCAETTRITSRKVKVLIAERRNPL